MDTPVTKWQLMVGIIAAILCAFVTLAGAVSLEVACVVAGTAIIMAFSLYVVIDTFKVGRSLSEEESDSSQSATTER